MTELMTPPQQATFRDPELDARFRRDGFVVVDFATPDMIAELLAQYERVDSGISDGYYPSLMSPDLGYKAEAHAAVRDCMWPVLGDLLEGYEPLLGVYMVKHPGPDTEVVPHQDWILADESIRPTMTAWTPLTPVSDESGRMRVLPGSHLWLEGLRGSPSFPTQWESDYERVRDELMEPVDISLGQAMVYDIRLLHGTPPNRSDATRVVTSLYAIPEGATPIHYYRDPEDGTVAGYEVPSDFCTRFNIGDVPQGKQFVEIRDYSIEPMSFDEIAAQHAAVRS